MTTPPPAPTQVTVLAPQADPGPPKWIPLVTVILAILGAIGMAWGVPMTVGAWRSQVDTSIDDVKKRLDKVEENQRATVPVLVGLQKDVSFLADRARREDERRDREAR